MNFPGPDSFHHLPHFHTSSTYVCMLSLTVLLLGCRLIYWLTSHCRRTIPSNPDSFCMWEDNLAWGLEMLSSRRTSLRKFWLQKGIQWRDLPSCCVHWTSSCVRQWCDVGISTAHEGSLLCYIWFLRGALVPLPRGFLEFHTSSSLSKILMNSTVASHP